MSKVKNKDLLKEAIADAKAVRETALRNAKLALEEAFTPKLQSMLSAKLQKEIEGEDTDEEDLNQVVDTNIDKNISVDSQEDIDSDESNDDAESIDEEEDNDMDMDNEPDGDEDDELDEDNEEEPDDEINEEEISLQIGKSDDKQPVKQIKTDDPVAGKVSEEDTEDQLDLEAIIRELEDDEDLDIDIEDDDEENEQEDNFSVEDNNDDNNDVEISMEELYNALKEMDGDESDEKIEDDSIEEDEDEQSRVAELEKEKDELEKELGEAYKVIKFMKNKLNEVNLINAKLLFANKLFKSFDLSPKEKVKVVETLDRAQNTREAKLVFVTLAESYNKEKTKSVSKSVKKLTETISRASKTQYTTKPKNEILNESDDMVARFKKLANLNKNKK